MREPMADLNPIAERIVAVNRVPALLMPGNLARIRSPVEFLAVEFLQDRRVKLRRDAKVDVRPFDRARAALGDSIDAVEDYQLPGVRHGERELFVAGHLFPLGKTESIAIPAFPLIEIGDLHTHVADARERHDFPLRLVPDGITAH